MHHSVSVRSHCHWRGLTQVTRPQLQLYVPQSGPGTSLVLPPLPNSLCARPRPAHFGLPRMSIHDPTCTPSTCTRLASTVTGATSARPATRRCTYALLLQGSPKPCALLTLFTGAAVRSQWPRDVSVGPSREGAHPTPVLPRVHTQRVPAGGARDGGTGCTSTVVQVILRCPSAGGRPRVCCVTRAAESLEGAGARGEHLSAHNGGAFSLLAKLLHARDRSLDLRHHFTKGRPFRRPHYEL